MNWKILLGLVIAYFVYLLIGAAVFNAIERPVELEQCEYAKAQVQGFQILLQNNRENITVANLADLTQVIQTALGYGIAIDENLNVTCSINWDFQSAFFFSGTVVTTIGYGHIAPNTNLGRAICILYAIIGIPVFALMFSGMGEVISKRIKRIDERVRGRAKRSWVAKTVVVLIVLGSFLIFCMLIPAAIFQAVEKWSYGDSFYYAFITLTTIGFGDFVAGNNPEITYVAIYRVMVYFWILFGMAFMATIITLISDFFKKTGKRARKRAGQSTETDGGAVEDEVDQGTAEDLEGLHDGALKESNATSDVAERQEDPGTSTGSNESLEKRPFTVQDGTKTETAVASV